MSQVRPRHLLIAVADLAVLSLPLLLQVPALAFLLWKGKVYAAVPELAPPHDPLQKHALVLVSGGAGRPGVDQYVKSLHERLIKGGLDRLNVRIDFRYT